MISKRKQNENKTFQIASGFLKDKTKLLVVTKKQGNGPERKLSDQNFSVLIENVSFRSRIWFQERIYSIFSGTKAAKRKLSILKEIWFDIATGGRLTKQSAIIPYRVMCSRDNKEIRQ
jgi:hypothetical protein